MADLTPDLQVSLSWGLIAKNFHSLQSPSVRCLQVILGLPDLPLPSPCKIKAVLTAQLECSIDHTSGAISPSGRSQNLQCQAMQVQYKCRDSQFTFVTRENHNFFMQNGLQSQMSPAWIVRGHHEKHTQICTRIPAFFSWVLQERRKRTCSFAFTNCP